MKRARVVPFVVGLPLASALSLALVLVSAPASAQSTNGYAVNKFEPAEKGSDWFANESLDLRGNFRPAIGVVGDYSTNQIAYYNHDGSPQGALVGEQIFVHLGASLDPGRSAPPRPEHPGRDLPGRASPYTLAATRKLLHRPVEGRDR